MTTRFIFQNFQYHQHQFPLTYDSFFKDKPKSWSALLNLHCYQCHGQFQYYQFRHYQFLQIFFTFLLSLIFFKILLGHCKRILYLEVLVPDFVFFFAKLYKCILYICSFLITSFIIIIIIKKRCKNCFLSCYYF